MADAAWSSLMSSGDFPPGERGSGEKGDEGEASRDDLDNRRGREDDGRPPSSKEGTFGNSRRGRERAEREGSKRQ